LRPPKATAWDPKTRPEVKTTQSHVQACLLLEPCEAKHRSSRRRLACRKDGRGTKTCDFGALVWAEFGRKANADGPNSGPKLPGPSARAVWDWFLVHPHLLRSEPKNRKSCPTKVLSAGHVSLARQSCTPGGGGWHLHHLGQSTQLELRAGLTRADVGYG
jgi:hypothetical protein